MTTQSIPEELYSKKSLFTLSGSAGAVWLVCLVLSNLDEEHKVLTVTMYKFIALGISLFLAIYMVLRDRRKKRSENYLFAFFNALLIFVNASGINAISNNVANLASEPDQVVSQTVEAVEDSGGFFALSLFKNEVDWWPNKKQERRIKELEALLAAKRETKTNTNTNTTAIDSITREFEIYKKRIEKQYETVKKELEDCNEVLKKDESDVSSNERDTATSTGQLKADLQLCKNKLDQYRGLYRQLFSDNKKVKDSLKACQKRYQID